MKTITAISIIIFLYLTSKTNAEECSTLRDHIETACDYPCALKLTNSKNLTLTRDNCNAEFNKNDWKDQPSVEFTEANPNKTYTLIGLDPNAPFHKKGEYFLHWIVANIPGEDFAKGDLSKGKQLQSYRKPGPLIGTGLHAYVFLAFEEEELNQNVENAPYRLKFGLLPWIQKQAKGLCGPVAGIQYQAKF